MSNNNTISPDLQAKIDALEDDGLRSNIVRTLKRSGTQAATNEEIFENMVARYEQVMIERAKLRNWHDDEVQDFIDFFKRELSDDYFEYLRQERENGAIDNTLSWKIGQLAERWMPGIEYRDCTNLLSRARDRMKIERHTSSEERT